jgi:DNA-binding SARP family transcriptional activator
MEFRILGPLEIRSERGAVALGGTKPRAVLAMLLLHANEPVSAERLALALWGKDSPAEAVRTVRVHVSRLRKALGDEEIVTTTPAGYCLRVLPGELDADCFARLADEGRQALAAGHHEHAAAVLREALTLWRGPPLADLRGEAFAAAEIRRLEELRSAATELAIELDLAQGRHREAVAELEAILPEHPLREHLHALRILALYRSGRQADALEAYLEARTTLVETIGVEPGAELRRLHEAVLRQDSSLELPGPALPPELVTATPLAGRERELAWLRDQWRDAREGSGAVLLLTGPEGIGKTRLAAELAAEAHHDGATVLYGAAPQNAERPTVAVLDEPADLPPRPHGPALVLVTARDASPVGADAVLALEPLGPGAIASIGRSYGALRVDGLVAAVEGNPARVHRLAAARAQERLEAVVLPRPLQPAAGQLPFTGRHEQLAYLTERWADIDVGTRRVVVIGGEAGIGKTRAAAELATRVHDEGSLVLYGRCDEALAAPYQPFVEALRRLLPTIDLDQLRRQLGGFAPELGRLLPELMGFGTPAPADAESARFALFEAVVALLECTTAHQRMLLVIDDVHWAAPATLLLLRHVIRSERPLAMLLIVTFRSTELQSDEPLAQLLADLHRDDSVERIALRGLDERAIDTLLRAAVGPELADRAAQLTAQVHAETAGNPFFVRELIAHLLESGGLAGISEGPTAALLSAKLDIPEGLRSVVCQRVARLSDPARQLMTIASVAAGTIDVALLDRLLPERAGLLDALDETVAAGLLVECGRGAFSFAHALVRQAVYDNLGTARRLDLHRRLGEALEARDDRQEHVEALAHHFAQLALDGEIDKAISYAIAAGHAATARLAYEDAVAHFQRGLDVLAQSNHPDARRHIDLLLGLGHAGWSTGESDEARHAFKQAAEIADRIDDAAAAANAALGFSGPFFEVGATLTRPSDALLQRALVLLDEDDSALRAHLMGRLAAVRAYAGGRHDHRALAHRALAMARSAGDKRVLADVLATCYWATRGPDDSDQHLRMAREFTLLAEEVGEVQLLGYGRAWVIGHLLERGELDGALRELDELQQLAETRNDRFSRWGLAASSAMLAFIQGHLERAESHVQEALQQWTDRPQFAPAAQVYAAQMRLLRREQGRLDEVVELVAAVVAQTPEVAAWRCALADMYAHLGDPDRAKRELELLGDLSSLPRDAFWLLSITRVATVASFLDDHRRSRHAYELLLPHANTSIVAASFLCEGSTSRPLGMLATTLGSYDDAEQHFERALTMNARIRSPVWTAHTQYEYSRMLRLRGTYGDHRRARTLLAAASATADELGLHALSERASAETRLTETG